MEPYRVHSRVALIALLSLYLFVLHPVEILFRGRKERRYFVIMGFLNFGREPSLVCRLDFYDVEGLSRDFIIIIYFFYIVI